MSVAPVDVTAQEILGMMQPHAAGIFSARKVQNSLFVQNRDFSDIPETRFFGLKLTTMRGKVP